MDLVVLLYTVYCALFFLAENNFLVVLFLMLILIMFIPLFHVIPLWDSFWNFFIISGSFWSFSFHWENSFLSSLFSDWFVGFNIVQHSSVTHFVNWHTLDYTSLISVEIYGDYNMVLAQISAERPQLQRSALSRCSVAFCKKDHQNCHMTSNA